MTATAPPVALVTGASRGIGAHLARAWAEAGWTVVGTSRSGELGALDGSDGRPATGVRGLALDVTDPGAVEAVVGRVVDEHGRIDVLVNNAGVIEPEVPLWESDPERWWATVETNVKGPYLLTRAVVPHMIAAGGGRIINLNSGSGTRENALTTAYCASKSALARITGGVALAGAEHGVLAFDLAPGVIRSDMTLAMDMHRDRTDWTDPTDLVELATALAEGRLDAYTGRMVRAGADAVVDLEAAARTGLPDGARMLRLRPWGPEDPLA